MYSVSLMIGIAPAGIGIYQLYLDGQVSVVSAKIGIGAPLLRMHINSHMNNSLIPNNKFQERIRERIPLIRFMFIFVSA